MSDQVVSRSEEQASTEKPYAVPDIVHELTLETRAGSPLGGDPLIDPLGVDPTAQ